MAKTRVAVLFGGVSSEHEVSLMSATNVIRSIPRKNTKSFVLELPRRADGCIFRAMSVKLLLVHGKQTRTAPLQLFPQTRFTRGLSRLKTGKPIIKRLMLSFRCCTAETAKTADYRDYWNWQSCRTLDAVL